ncbi:hypothetical protein U1Q18_033608 [Sarracenia purpurea var. burkii]
MECATKPPSKSFPNISDIVSKFANVCRFKSIGVLSTENPSHNHLINDIGNNAPLAEDSSDATDEGECNGEKVHPHPSEIQPQTTESAKVEIFKLFDTISSLKLAYVRVQEAHIPYDPDKIKAADGLFMAELEELIKIKRAYKSRQFKRVNCTPARSLLLLSKIQQHEKLLEKLKFHFKIKNTQMLNLQHELHDLDLKNSELVEELRHKERVEEFRQKEKESVKVMNYPSFEDIFKAASMAVHDFAKPLISLMKASGWDLDRAADSIEASVVYSRRSHKKYAFEAYIARRMFYKMPSQSFNVDSILRFDNPIDALIIDPHSTFAKFCRTKYLSLIHPIMEASFFGNLDHRAFVSSGRHPRTPFYQAFVKMARWIWVLQGIASLSEPIAEIYVVKRGSGFSEVYMEGVEELNKDTVVSGEELSRFKVEFVVMPGFRVGETLVRSRVYLSTL